MSYLNVFSNKSFFKIKKVEIEGETFYLREMSIKDKRDLITGKNLEQGAKASEYYDYFAEMVLRCLCDEKGNLTEEPEHFEDLKKLIPDSVMSKLQNVVMDVNGLSKKSEEEIKNA